MDMTPDAPEEDWVALTEYELREVTMHMPGRLTVPVTTRGFGADQVLAIQASGSGGLHALVALARLRQCRSGPQVQEPQTDAQEAAGPAEPAATFARPALDEALQARFEAFLSNIGVDPAKWDHQNLAGELADGVMAQLRERGVLNIRQITRDWYLSSRQSVRAAVARGVSRASLSSLNEAARVGQLVQEEMDAVFELRSAGR